MTSWAHTSYLVRYLKQFGYIKQRKIHNGKVHRHKKSLFIPIELHSVTISKVINYNQYKQFHPKKKKGKGERENEKKERKGKGKSRRMRQKRKEQERKEQRKKANRKEKEREEVEKRRRRKGMEGVCAEGKEKRRRKEREREKEKGENGETREKHNSHKQKPGITEPESSEEFPEKTTRLRRFLSHKLQLRTGRIKV